MQGTIFSDKQKEMYINEALSYFKRYAPDRSDIDYKRAEISLRVQLNFIANPETMKNGEERSDLEIIKEKLLANIDFGRSLKEPSEDLQKRIREYDFHNPDFEALRRLVVFSALKYTFSHLDEKDNL